MTLVKRKSTNGKFREEANEGMVKAARLRRGGDTLLKNAEAEN